MVARTRKSKKEQDNESKAVAVSFPVLLQEDPVESWLTSLSLVKPSDTTIQELCFWLEEEWGSAQSKTLLTPNTKMASFLEHARSIVALGHQHWTSIEQDFPPYTYARLQRASRLLIAVRLLTEYRSAHGRRKANNPEMEQIAEQRGWGTLANVTESIKESDQRLLVKGRAALLDLPKVQERFLAGRCEGSCSQVMACFRARLDVALEHTETFVTIGLDEEALGEMTQLLQDATIFHRGGAERELYATQLTLFRNKAFTLAVEELGKLQHVIQAVMFDDPDFRETYDRTFWNRLNRFSRVHKG
ncbi:MAG: hypothetical protein EP343_34745 [Deltaproteobacteria bacterium]|nr:MAG: hypothetical protein EP343_34745 [Deltaproteobacteria bacterium]